MNVCEADRLNLKDAFPDTPKQCRDALLSAATSVKEEEKMKRATFRTVLIAAILVVISIAVALAASQLGLSDLFKQNYNIELSTDTKAALMQTEQKTYAVGPVTVTVRETLADGRLAYMTTEAKTTDGSQAIIDMDADGLYQSLSAGQAKALGLPEGTIRMDAAKQLKLPVYFISAYLGVEKKDRDINGSEMLERLLAEDGSYLFINMIQTNSETVQETLNGKVQIYVNSFDIEKMENIKGESWRFEDEITIPVNGITEEKTLKPKGNALYNGVTVTSVKAEKTSAGIYLTAELAVPEGMDLMETWGAKLPEFTDENGQAFSYGIILSSSLDTSAAPTAYYKTMITAESIPETLRWTNAESGETVIFK